jgi:hypothetical protein
MGAGRKVEPSTVQDQAGLACTLLGAAEAHIAPMPMPERGTDVPGGGCFSKELRGYLLKGNEFG